MVSLKRLHLINMHTIVTGTRKKNCIRNNVAISHLTVFPSDDSCNKCDCFDGKISCTQKYCADPIAICEEGKFCENNNQCGENGLCLGEGEMHR